MFVICFVNSVLIIVFDTLRIIDKVKVKNLSVSVILDLEGLKCFFEYDLYCTPKNVDTIFFFILTTVLTRSISSFFSNDREVRIKNIKKYGEILKNKDLEGKNLDMHKFVFLQINEYKKASEFLGHQRLYIEVEDKDDDLEYIRSIKEFYTDKEYNKVEEFYLAKFNELEDEENEADEEKFMIVRNINDENKKDIVKKIIFEKLKKPVGKRFLKEKIEKYIKNKINIPETKIIAEELVKHARVYANILEIGLFQYITYSHRSRKKLMESYINSGSEYEKKLIEEIDQCEQIEKMLNHTKHID
ncbi:11391_t:CDS:2, partial [Dentiscutata erythropus]